MSHRPASLTHSAYIMKPDVLIRPERPEDYASVYEVNARAFDQPDEARLVEKMRIAGGFSISLVAVVEHEVVGHILFTPVTIAEADLHPPAMGLAPMAVDPARQRQGIGGELIRAGLHACRRKNSPAVFVLGHAEYYPRFGFRPAAPLGLHYRDESMAPYFFVMELRRGALAGVTGRVRYHDAFESV
jgi:putative acetyltransferase